MFRRFCPLLTLVLGLVTSLLTLAPLGAQAPDVTKDAVPGVTNFARVGSTVACGGAITPEALAAVKRMGFAAVINLRLSSESGAGIDAEAAAAKVAGLRFVHLPFNASAPEPSVVDQFLTVIADPANQPAFIHCASGNRAAAMWMVKRVRADGWGVAQAGEEAAALGLTNSGLRQFVLDYLKSHERGS
jgi:uncharacterized protein (TIGR01244 family)